MEAVARAHSLRKPVLAMLGAHVLKVGLSPLIVDLMEKRIITAVAKKLEIPKEKIFVNIHRYGNMSAASIAVALYEAVREKRIQKGDTDALVAFGAGLVSAANVVVW